VGAADKAAIEEAIKEVREALKTDDVARVKQASETLTKASHKMAEAMYREAQPKAPGASADAGGGGNGRTKTAEGEVVDAEFEDLGPKN
jgi:molecular chaperone DnaK